MNFELTVRRCRDLRGLGRRYFSVYKKMPTPDELCRLLSQSRLVFMDLGPCWSCEIFGEQFSLERSQLAIPESATRASYVVVNSEGDPVMAFPVLVSPELVAAVVAEWAAAIASVE